MQLISFFYKNLTERDDFMTYWCLIFGTWEYPTKKSGLVVLAGLKFKSDDYEAKAV